MINIMQYLSTFFSTIILLLSAQGAFAQSVEADESSHATNNILDEIKTSVTSATQPTPSIGDALTTSSSIPNSTSEGNKGTNDSPCKIDECLDNIVPNTPSIGDALTTSNVFSNLTSS